MNAEGCEYCGREVVAERQNDNGRMEKLCESCMSDLVMGDELAARDERRHDAEE